MVVCGMWYSNAYLYTLLHPSTSRSTLVHLVKTEGIRGLGKGFSLNIIKGPITLSISLTTYDMLMSWIRKAEGQPK
jgi:hypothetical protein